MHRDNIQKLYLMENELGRYKIGISVNPEGRRTTIEMASGVSVKLLHTWDCILAESLEKVLHRKLKEHHFKGEWFCTDKSPIGLIQKVVAMEKELCLEFGVKELKHRKDKAYDPVRSELFNRILRGILND